LILLYSNWFFKALAVFADGLGVDDGFSISIQNRASIASTVPGTVAAPGQQRNTHR